MFETGQSGVQRHEVATGRTETIWFSPEFGGHVAFDASYWTPWGTYITAEESWCSDPAGCTASPFGRLFELKNPTTAPAITEPLTETSNDGAEFVHQNVIPRTSHEGIQFDKAGNMYFIDELNGGSLYKYTPAASWGEIQAGRSDYFAAGQTSVLRVGDGNTPNATGSLHVGAHHRRHRGRPARCDHHHRPQRRDIGRRSQHDRPAGVQGHRLPAAGGHAAPDSGRRRVPVCDDDHDERGLPAGPRTPTPSTCSPNRATTDLATGAAVGSALASPDNLAIDHDGNIYIVEDRNGGVDDDIWFARDLNQDGDLSDAGEGIARWASNGTVGSEFTGLYFDPTDKRRAWVNIQHPDSDNDRTIEITIP